MKSELTFLDQRQETAGFKSTDAEERQIARCKNIDTTRYRNTQGQGIRGTKTERQEFKSSSRSKLNEGIQS